MMIHVIKRDGKIVDFDLNKIKKAMQKAFDSVQAVYDDSILDVLALRVGSKFSKDVKEKGIQVEEIQDHVEYTLCEAGYVKVAKAYILYRKQREALRNISDATIEYKNSVDSYLHDESWRQQEGGFSSYSVAGLILSNSGVITSNYWLQDVYDMEISNLYREGWIHIHDLDMLTADCASWSLQTLIEKGIVALNHQVASRPAKHLTSLCNQIVKFLGIVQNEWAGAQTLLHIDTFMAPFVKKDKLPFKTIKDCMETLVYGINTTSRWGMQAPFICIDLDWKIPTRLFNETCKIGGESLDFTYGQCQEEMELVQRALLEVFYERDDFEAGFQFPILSVPVFEGFENTNPVNRNLLFSCCVKYGTPHFVNKMYAHASSMHGYFGYASGSGSIGAVSINLARLGFVSHSKVQFFEHLEHILSVCVRSLVVKREVLSHLMEAGFYPFTSKYILDLSKHVSVIGVVGYWQMVENASWLSENNRQAFAKELLEWLSNRLNDYSKKHETIFTLDQTPAEGVSHRFAKLDKLFDETMPSTKKSYYTNSTQVSVDYSDDLFKVAFEQEELHNLYSGNTFFDIPLLKCTMNAKECESFVLSFARLVKIPCFALSPVYSICKTHGYKAGIHDCDDECDIYSRVAGYYRSIDSCNIGKQEEFRDRVYFDVK